MNQSFKGKVLGMKEWMVTDECILFKGQKMLYENIISFELVTAPTTKLTNGIIKVSYNGQNIVLSFSYDQKMKVLDAIEFVKGKVDEAHGVVRNYKYLLVSHTGTKLEVYDDYLILYHMQVGNIMKNIINGGLSGGKRINFSDITSVQYKEPTSLTAGYIQFAYPGSTSKGDGVIDAVNNENAIVFGLDKKSLAEEIVRFVQSDNKKSGSFSAADEILKFKKLFDAGVINEEEFNKKKEELLNL